MSGTNHWKLIDLSVFKIRQKNNNMMFYWDSLLGDSFLCPLVVSGKLLLPINIIAAQWRDARDAERCEASGVLVSLRNTPVAREPGVFPLSPLLHALPYKTEVGGSGRKDYFPCFVASPQERRQKNKRLGTDLSNKLHCQVSDTLQLSWQWRLIKRIFMCTSDLCFKNSLIFV